MTRQRSRSFIFHFILLFFYTQSFTFSLASHFATHFFDQCIVRPLLLWEPNKSETFTRGERTREMMIRRVFRCLSRGSTRVDNRWRACVRSFIHT